MQISKAVFCSVVLLILLIPILAQADLFLFGIRTEGTVTGTDWVASKRGSGYTYAEIECKTANQVIIIYGPQNVGYKTSEKLMVIYDKQNLKNHLLVNFWSIYLRSSGVIATLLLILWTGLYRALSLQKAEQELIHEK
ncbi:hypothetical protein Q0590_13280 [Rhodocytophaga aerolata]|uniref:DUF3592 domain-containing protein n=1 Tax=Rhodocytophaga aerolata TaxID=455078 RepID=A0ABT8R6F2_9BACT|nr:hypothetical protein [Rhodocytophaga aerolata]MDO1447236.1 hypothetical protein [Rhodocytophaga aerolata]